MKTFKSTFYILSSLLILSSCGNDGNHASGNSAVMEGSNKDDIYQRSGYGDSIPSDSIKEEIRQDSIRIAKSNHHNK